MNFLHPEFLYLAPLVAAPILIHLLNRVRYRRMRWAAIEFLLATERRAVRRARLRQILLMVLRTLLLAAALGALAQPIFRGGLAGLLGGSTRIAVLVDASASMSAADAAGPAFDRAKRLAAGTLASLPRGARATGGTFALRYECPFREPVQDRAAVASVIESAEMTSAVADVPQAIRAAAESLERAGGGGTIWLLTDLQAGGWQAGSPGAWEQVRRTLEKAGKPRIVITDLAPNVKSNLSIARVRVSPEVLVEGDTPRLAATVVLHGGVGGVHNVTLVFDGRRIDTRAVEFSGPGMADVVFHLPPLASGPRAGYLELEPDALPADDRYYFLLRPTRDVPVLIVDGMPSAIPFEGAGVFLALALRPPGGDAAARSRFSVRTISPAELVGASLSDFAAVCLADVPRLGPDEARALRDFVSAGGLLIVFPGVHTNVAAWNESGFPGTRIESVVEAGGGKRVKVNWASPNCPVTATLAAEGLARLAISRFFCLAPSAPAEVLATVEDGGAFLVRRQLGKGKIYLFAVSCQSDFSNLPFTPVLLLMLHRAVLSHLVEAGEPLARPAFAELRLSVPPGAHRMLTPDGRTLPLLLAEDAPGEAIFDRTGRAGIYRLVAGDVGPRAAANAVAVAALNVPAEESALDRMDPRRIRALLQGFSVDVLGANWAAERVGRGTGARSAASGFPLAVLALIFLVGEVLVAWSIGRPAVSSRENRAA